MKYGFSLLGTAVYVVFLLFSRTLLFLDLASPPGELGRRRVPSDVHDGELSPISDAPSSIPPKLFGLFGFIWIFYDS